MESNDCVEARFCLQTGLSGSDDEDHRFGMILSVDPTGIGACQSVRISRREKEIATGFTVLVNKCVFGFGISPVLSEACYTLLNTDGTPDWESMREFIDDNSVIRLNPSELPSSPFIVVQDTSGNMYSVSDRMDERPSKLHITVNGWGKKTLARSQSSLRDFYKAAYNIDLEDNQPILLSCLGCCVKSRALVEPSKASPSTSDKKESAVYLVPQTVRFHPFSRIYKYLTLVPRTLFWLEAGIIAKRVSSIIASPLNASYFHLHDVFIPLKDFGYSFESSLTSLTHVALTCPSAMMGYNYRKLEWLGDSVLGLIVANADISDKQKIISNGYIGSQVCAKHSKIFNESVLTRCPTIKSWAECRSRVGNQNIIADIAEALIGVAFLCSGLKGALHAVRSLGILNLDIDEINEAEKLLTCSPEKIKFIASLETIERPQAKRLSLQEWDKYRQSLIS